MSKAIAAIFLWFSLYGVGIMSMMKAWGLEVHSWGWLAFSYFLMFLITVLMSAISED